MKKIVLRRYFKIGLHFMGILLLFNCEKEISFAGQEQMGNRTVTRISLNEFKQAVKINKKLDHFRRYFDVSIPLANEFNRLEISDTPTILTNEIAVIDKGDYKTYTFKIVTATVTDIVYNLVLYVDVNDQVYDSYILEYNPSEEYASGTSQYYSGTIKVSDNDLFDTNDLLATHSRQCVIGVHTAWECSFGNPHGPGECNGTSFEMTFTLIWGDCPAEEDHIIPPSGGDGSSGGGGGSGSGNGNGNSGSDNGIVTTLVDPRCTGGKILDTATGNCICPAGKVEDVNGNCICIEGAVEYASGICVVQTPPCDAIKRKINNPNFKQKLEELATKTGDTAESGYSQARQGPFTVLEVGNNGHSAHIPEDEDTIGYMHTHIDKFKVPDINGDGIDDFIRPVKMFSPNDLITFLKYVKNVEFAGLPISDAYGIMISSSRTYILQFTGDLSEIRTNYTRAEKDALKIMIKEDYFDEYSNKARAFLHFVKDKIGTAGISLYRIKDDGTVQEKKLKDNGRIETIDCE